MSRKTDPMELELDALLAEARSAPPPPLPAALQARLLADALAVQAAAPRRPAPLARLRDWLADLGGLPGMAGLTAAGVAGLWIGLAEPMADLPLASLIRAGAAEVSPTLAGYLELDSGTPFAGFDPFE